MKNISPAIILLLLSVSCLSQRKVPGYIVTDNGDTLSGIIRRTGGLNDKPGFTFFDERISNIIHFFKIDVVTV